MTAAHDQPEETPTAAPDPLVGLTIGNYVVEKKLGEGGMGAVYRMQNTSVPGTYLALKVLTLRGGADATREMAERFAQEARAASAVGSHRVVSVVDVGQLGDGTRYLMMEYVPGRSIGQAIEQDGPMDVRKALMLCARVADTLALAHQRGIIHRDIKPPNLMLVDEGDDPTVKILDFGVARATGDAKIAHTTERKIIGSPGYMPPEAAVGTAVDGRADVFSLAATLFEMLTGRLPFVGATFQALMMATIQDPIPPAGAVRPAHLTPIPDVVEAILAWGLTKDPAARPPMAEFRAALVEAAEAMAQGRRGSGPVLASVMRNFTPSPSERPTLSAGTAEASEILARYGTPPPSRPQPSPSPRSQVKPATVLGDTTSAPTRATEVISDEPPGARNRTVLLISLAIVVVCLGIAAGALLLPPRSAPPPVITTQPVNPEPANVPPPPPAHEEQPRVVEPAATPESASGTPDPAGDKSKPRPHKASAEKKRLRPY